VLKDNVLRHVEAAKMARDAQVVEDGFADLAVLVFKLHGYRLGGEMSERQWTDVLGVLKTQGDRVDFAYLDHWAAEIGVKDLLDRIRTQV